MTRPITVVYQELAAVTPTGVEPDLNTIVVASAYQILDYADDKTNIQVADYGELNADNPYVPPIAATPAIVIAAPPSIVPGGWVDPDSVHIYLDDFRVILADGTDGSVTSADNLLTSASSTFITDGVAAGDTVIIDNPVGPATPNLVLTVRTVVSETTLTVSTNFLATTASLDFRVERTLHDTQVNSSFVSLPAFGVSNEITLLGGVTVAVNAIQRVVSFANVYVEYRAFRTDLQAKLSIDPGTAITDIETKIGKIDARNPLGALCFTATQNAGQAPIYAFGVESDDLVGYTAARDLLSSDKVIYAVVVGTPLLSIIAMFNADNVTLADPELALSTGVPQKFRVAIGSVPLVTTEDVVAEVTTGTSEIRSGAIPAGNRRVTFGAELVQAAGVRPGDILQLSATYNGIADGNYTIAHINGASVLETNTAVPTLSSLGANVRIYRPSTGADVIALADYRGYLVRSDVRFTSMVAGSGALADGRTVSLVNAVTVPVGSIQSIVEVANTSTVITGHWANGTLTAADVVAAVNLGTGVLTPFTGSINLVASTVVPATVVAAAAPAALSTGTAGVNDVTLAALDAVYIRLFDAAATFLTNGVVPGDIIEIPTNPNATFSTGTKRFVVNEVISEQRLEIVNIVSGAYVNNSSATETELPHLDNRLGTGTNVTQGSIRYRLIRNLTKDQQADRLVTIGQSVRSQRAIITWSDSVKVSGLKDGSKPRLAGNAADDADPQPGTFLAAVVGGMTAGLPNHQGFSRIGCAGIDEVFHSQNYFTERQLTRISEGGIYVFVQDSPESLPYSIHQVTTDTSALQTGEYSMVKNFDYLSKFFVAILDAFIGKWNVTEELLGFQRQAVNSGVQTLKTKRVARIGAPLTDAAIVSLAVSTASPDRVELYINVGRPTPLNVIGLHLIG